MSAISAARRLRLILLIASALAVPAGSDADPPAAPPCDGSGILCIPQVFCFRMTDIKFVASDPEGESHAFEFEVLNWTGTEAFGLTLALNTGTGGKPGKCDTLMPSISVASVDQSGRPLGAGGDDGNFPPADLLPGVKVGQPNGWVIVSQSETSVRFASPTSTPGTGLPARNLLGSASTAEACGLVNGCAVSGGFPTVSNSESVDNGAPSTDGLPDNVLDGFAIEIDSIDPGEMISMNWFLTDALGAPIGFSGKGNVFGFGVFNVWATRDSVCVTAKAPGPAVWARMPSSPEGPGTNEGTSSDIADMFVRSSDAGDRFEVELGGALTATFLNPADNFYNAPINAIEVGGRATNNHLRVHAAPNPSNPAVTFSFELATEVEVRLNIYDLAGRPIRKLVDRSLPRGRQSITWDGTNGNGMRVASGVYLYRLEVGADVVTNKVVLVK